MIYDYIIVGTGISGINTAYKINKKYPNRKILLLDKNNYIGGRIHSIYLKDYGYKNNSDFKDIFYESGAIRFYPSHTNLINLLKEFDYTKKDFYIIGKDLKIDYKFKNIKNFKKSENYYYEKIFSISKKYDNEELNRLKFSIFLKKHFINEEIKYLKVINGFPHLLETNTRYAIELLKRDFYNIEDFYILKDSLTNFLNKIVSKFNKNVKIMLDKEVIDYNFNENDKLFNIQINSNIKKLKTQNLIFSIPYLDIRKFKTLPKNLIETVIPIELNRMFAIFPKNNFWHNDINATYTDNHIQRIYLKSNRLIQIAYSSHKNANYWNKQYKNGELKKKLLGELKNSFPDKKIEEPELLNMHYWEAGIHLWKNNTNSEMISKNILQPFDNQNLFLCNEAYSKNQRWMEGSLEMSNRLIKLL